MKIFVSYGILSVIFSISVGVNAQIENLSACTTPANGSGLCIRLKSCTSLFNQVLKGKELTPDERLYLSRSQCGGYVDNQPLVCCPDINSALLDDVLPRPGECGINLMDHIIRGIEAAVDTYTWMALLEYSKPNDTKGLHCVGVLISKRYVLTAAHCVSGKDIPNNWNLTGVRLGEHNILTDPDCEINSWGTDCTELVVNMPISEKIIHERYVSESRNRINDIALLRLQSEIVYSDFVNPICLPRSAKLRNTNYDDIKLEDAGWYKETSSHSVKLTGHIDMVKNNQCNILYNTVGVSINEMQLCGISRPTTYMSCLGLSGSPLMGIDDNSNWYIAGIESFKPPTCGPEGLPNVYTRVASYIDWIESNLHA